EDFRKALLDQSSVPFVTYLLVLSNLAVFLWMVFEGVSPAQPTAMEIIDWGANYAPRTLDGEEWRLFTCMFLHIGILHLGMNMLALWNLGRIVERLVGPVGFVLLYLVSGLAGSLASVFWNGMNPSAGASGAIFGVAGALLGWSWKLRQSLPQSFLRSSRFLAWNVLVLFGVFTLINLYRPMIDNSAHLAGLLVGAVCGLLLGEPIPNPGTSKRRWRNILVAVIGGGGLFLASSLMPGPPADIVKLVTKYQRVRSTLNEKLEQAAGRYDAKAMKEQEYATFLEKEIIPPWRELHADFASADNVPPAFQTTIQSYMDAFVLYETSFELKIEEIREENPQKGIQSEQRFKEANEIIERIGEEG
ncbi:MAG: rhomboid family intramembrane serine protease, partial [Planctomycetaceae bacterium]|nr:rhomboid family intramembrane serine protease [Planctomycetaceae bacterium]